MSIPDETLRKVLNELQNRLAEHKRQLSNVKVQITLKEREKRMAELTKKELSAIEKDTKTYKSIGKAFIKTDISVLDKEQDDKIAKSASDLVTLDNSKKYLERNINDLLKDVH
ncbi:4051_t:CDS:2 [Funneliformis geosporum]|uniref:8052_t:CDS:1 n=1 Tax=Funneliformis geosporum TaxID=1117311 RepID=A0A9W4T165_9GLOM|nr:4051_t:CDS:2 [Funneliformis geosporum]CAI2188011.1 8052_t:CDS:2 [Funneliformis geosporum]